MIVKVVIKTCTVCGDEFVFNRTGRGRDKTLCSDQCRRESTRRNSAKYRTTDKGKAALERAARRHREKYDPWLWENTILEWNE